MIIRLTPITYRIQCETCNEHLVLPGKYIAENPAHLQNDAGRHGWTSIDQDDYCPQHS